MSKKAAVGRALLKVLKWAGVTLAREGVDIIVDKTTSKPDLKISRPGEHDSPTDRLFSGSVVLDGTLRERMLTHPDELREAIQRERERHL